MSAVRRARIALGTLVEMRVEGLSEHDATRALDAASPKCWPCTG